MPAKFLIIHKSAKKNLLKLPIKIHKKVISSLGRIKNDPRAGIKLHGELGSYFKSRLGDYRIVYKFNSRKSLVEVVKIEHRQGVYK
ncbi:type II toxin-antitoxin system RelE/ParE family toxin [Patescibacteria group bacterium]|nr:type II toxin-antitoxin system RelE/ParE family toxin [Patescibacteria group bacterium]